MDIHIQFDNHPLHFTRPCRIISCEAPASFLETFREMEAAIAAGYYLAGFFSYDAGALFEERLARDGTCDLPLIHMGVYDSPRVERCPSSRVSVEKRRLKDLRINITKEEYFSHIEKIRRYIALGDVYQVTYCIKLLLSFSGDPFALYRELLREQPVPYPAYIETDDFQILSLSPEKFMEKRGEGIVTKPMKGTWPRGEDLLSDLVARLRFQYDAKNRAENVMIADLLRNDLGRIGTGIRAPRLFEIAGYTTLFQMTSTVTGRVAGEVPLYDLFAAVFPSGSVTGAPKIRAMEIIRELEGDRRRIYTGAIGYITPEKDLSFNIPIRTILLRSGKGEMGIGGGIVWDSTPQGEWDEGMLKAKFLAGDML